MRRLVKTPVSARLRTVISAIFVRAIPPAGITVSAPLAMPARAAAVNRATTLSRVALSLKARSRTSAVSRISR